MKQLISSLLDAISPYEFSNCDIEELIVLAADALESGALDCLVKHPASEPPDTDREVMAYCSDDAMDEHACWLFAQFKGGAWYMHNLDFVLLDVVTWRELPPVPEVTE